VEILFAACRAANLSSLSRINFGKSRTRKPKQGKKIGTKSLTALALCAGTPKIVTPLNTTTV